MNPEHARFLMTARLCMARLCGDERAPKEALDLYDSALTRLLVINEPFGWASGPVVELPVDVARGTSYATAHQAVGALITFGVPWDDLRSVLADLSEAWGIEHVASCSECLAHEQAPSDGGRMSPAHYWLYRVARTNLYGLAATVPATSLVDYWFVLESLDSLYDTEDRVAAEAPATDNKRVLYGAARAAIEQLGAYGLDEWVLLTIVGMLERTWQQDPDHVGILARGDA
ncbi:hypothetical protein [Georgenia yuyongxinii]|uniref:Uncharacterized protein n=1 Tax=Georgenia yuyongxinii TaxID=2589797 RepID=A0A552WX97_9MICO|nr:hypothetical protein [Georgenia yuyongxinii]TRW47450.1 hypothetical protein FJ693_01225 [Georgenia yuyongxinii]